VSREQGGMNGVRKESVMEISSDLKQEHCSLLTSHSSFVRGCDCSIVIKTSYREFDVPYSEETLR